MCIKWNIPEQQLTLCCCLCKGKGWFFSRFFSCVLPCLILNDPFGNGILSRSKRQMHCLVTDVHLLVGCLEWAEAVLWNLWEANSGAFMALQGQNFLHKITTKNRRVDSRLQASPSTIVGLTQTRLLWLWKRHFPQLHFILIAYSPSTFPGSFVSGGACFGFWSLCFWGTIHAPCDSFYLACICLLLLATPRLWSLLYSPFPPLPRSDEWSMTKLAHWQNSQDKSGFRICYAHKVWEK